MIYVLFTRNQYDFNHMYVRKYTGFYEYSRDYKYKMFTLSIGTTQLVYNVLNQNSRRLPIGTVLHTNVGRFVLAVRETPTFASASVYDRIPLFIRLPIIQ